MNTTSYMATSTPRVVVIDHPSILLLLREFFSHPQNPNTPRRYSMKVPLSASLLGATFETSQRGNLCRTLRPHRQLYPYHRKMDQRSVHQYTLLGIQYASLITRKSRSRKLCLLLWVESSKDLLPNNILSAISRIILYSIPKIFKAVLVGHIDRVLG